MRRGAWIIIRNRRPTFPSSSPPDTEFFKKGNKTRMSQQVGSNLKPHCYQSNALTTKLPTAAAESTDDFCYLCTNLINVCVVSPDPNPRGLPMVGSISVCREQLSGVPRVVEGTSISGKYLRQPGARAVVQSASICREHLPGSTSSCPKYLQLSRVIFVR